jgi:hypothetical protein
MSSRRNLTVVRLMRIGTDMRFMLVVAIVLSMPVRPAGGFCVDYRERANNADYVG